MSYVLRFLFATRLAIMGRVLSVVYRTIATYLFNQVPHAPVS